MSHRERTTDHDLLGRLAGDDDGGEISEDWSTFVTRYHPKILAIARSKAGDDDAHDIAQEVLMKLVRRLRKGWSNDSQRNGFEALLHVIISHCTASYFKSKNRQLRGGDELPTGPVLEKALRRRAGVYEPDGLDEIELAGELPEKRRLLNQIFDEIPEEDRRLLTYDGKGASLAEELGKTHSAMRIQKHRAKKRFEKAARERMVQWRTEPRPSADGRFALEHLTWAGQMILDQRQDTRPGPALLLRRLPTDSKEDPRVESIRLEAKTDVGRDTFVNLDPPLFDPEISGSHCRIEHLGEGSWRVEDLGSRNHTLLNGKVCLSAGQQTQLCDGDRLEIGRLLLVFSTGEMAREATT